MRTNDGVASYGERFRALRKAAGFKTQGDLAKKVLGNHVKGQGTIGRWEQTRGKIPTPEIIERHAKWLECRVSDLVGPVDDTWLDRARRGDYDQPSRGAAPGEGAGPTPKRRKAG